MMKRQAAIRDLRYELSLLRTGEFTPTVLDIRTISTRGKSVTHTHFGACRHPFGEMLQLSTRPSDVLRTMSSAINHCTTLLRFRGRTGY